MNENEREKEKKGVEASYALADERLSEAQSTIDTGKTVADISAEERFYNRSVKIRRLIMEWLALNVNKPFSSLGELEAKAANYAMCSMPTARRWVFQFIQDEKPFWIQEKQNFYIIRERPSR